MLTSAAGDRSNVFNVVVVLTDGGSNTPTATQVTSIGYKICYVLVIVLVVKSFHFPVWIITSIFIHLRHTLWT